MHIVWILLVGLLVGTFARFLMPGRVGGIFATIALGIAGSALAGFLGPALGLYQTVDGISGVIASIIGAMLILFVFGLFVGRRRRDVGA